MKALFKLIASQALTVWFMGLFIVYYLTAAIWAKEAFSTFIINLSSNNIVRLIYITFVVNITARILKNIGKNYHDRFRVLISLPLYVGIVLFLVASFLSINMRQSRWVLVGRGDIVKLEWDRKKFGVSSIDSALKKKLLRMDDSLIFDYEPYITLMDNDSYLYKIGAFPPSKVSESYMHILNFGIAPGIELRRDNSVVSAGYVVQKLIPLGTVDTFEIKPFPYTFYLRIVPNAVTERGEYHARRYNLDKPLYGLEIVEGEKKIYEGTSDSLVTFDGNMELRFSPPINWVLLEAVHDPFYLWFIASLIILPVGFLIYPLRFLGARQSE